MNSGCFRAPAIPSIQRFDRQMKIILAAVHLALSVLVALCAFPALARQQPPAEKTAQPTAPPPDLGGVKLRYAGVRWSLLYGSYRGRGRVCRQ